MLYLVGDNTYVDAPLMLDDSPYFNDYLLSPDPGDTYTGTLFNVSLPDGTPFGLYTGYFDITGGADDSAQDVIGVADFSVVATPEPNTLLLLISGRPGSPARCGGALRDNAPLVSPHYL